MEKETAIWTVIAILFVGALTCVAGSYNYYVVVQQPFNATGVVSSYHTTTDIFGYQQYELAFYGGQTVNWSEWKFMPSHQYLMNGYVGWNIHAKEGNNCTVSFVGFYMQNSSGCR